jgi:hypothetical protein
MLEPDELARLLTEAVEPIRSSPDAYRRIQAGIARRRRLRLPAFTLGGMVMAALVALAVVAIRPSPSSQVVEPAAPPVMPTTYTEPTRAGTVPSLGGSGRGGSGGGSGGSGSATHASTSVPTTRTTDVTPPPAATASQSPASSGTTPRPGSPQLPTPVAKPAGVNDIDGDGRPDTIGAAADGTTLQIQFSRDNQVARVPLSGISTPLNSAVVDIDADGFGELLVQTGVSGGVRSYALLRYVSLDQVVTVNLPSGLTLAAGVRGNSANGFRCIDHGLQINTGTSTDGSQFNVVTSTLRFTPDGLTTEDTASSTVRLPADSSPFVAACGTLS